MNLVNQLSEPSEPIYLKFFIFFLFHDYPTDSQIRPYQKSESFKAIWPYGLTSEIPTM